MTICWAIWLRGMSVAAILGLTAAMTQWPGSSDLAARAYAKIRLAVYSSASDPSPYHDVNRARKGDKMAVPRPLPPARAIRPDKTKQTLPNDRTPQKAPPVVRQWFAISHGHASTKLRTAG